MNVDGPTTIQVIPVWFLVLATILLIANVALFCGLAFVSFQLWKMTQRLEPKVNKLGDQVNDDLVPQVKGLVARVDSIGSNLENLTGSARSTMGMVEGKAASVGSALETLTTAGLQKAEKFAPWVGYLMMGLRVYQTISTIRSARATKHREEAETEVAQEVAKSVKALPKGKKHMT